MSREELRKLVSHTFAWDLVGESGSVREGQEELIDAMAGSYNRAIDDALEALKDPEISNGFDGRDALLRLKI